MSIRLRALSVAFALTALIVPSPVFAAPRFVALFTPAGCSSTGVKINRLGNVVYNVDCNGISTAYLYLSLQNHFVQLQRVGGAPSELACDIDDNNFVVGEVIPMPGKHYAAIWSPSGVGQLLRAPKGTIAQGMSASAGAGYVVGTVALNALVAQAVELRPSPPGPRFIGHAPPPVSELDDVNNAGTAVGQLGTQAASSVLPAPLAVLPGFPLGISSIANAINAGGTVVGAVTVAATPACPIHHGYAFEEINNFPINRGTLPRDCWASEEDVNDRGIGVGKSGSNNVMTRAVEWTQAPFDLSVILGLTPGWKSLTDASGINDFGGLNNLGQIVGTGVNRAGTPQAFCLL